MRKFLTIRASRAMSASDPSFQETPGTPPVTAPQGQPYTETREFGTAAVLGIFAVGALIGAAAVILAPPGSRTGRDLGRRLRRLAGRDRTPWEKLRRTLDRAAEQRRTGRRAAKPVAAAGEAITS
ncbi:hypothetical protein BH23GEM2_BH23GEM2_08600 [soil metagenome]